MKWFIILVLALLFSSCTNFFNHNIRKEEEGTFTIQNDKQKRIGGTFIIQNNLDYEIAVTGLSNQYNDKYNILPGDQVLVAKFDFIETNLLEGNPTELKQFNNCTITLSDGNTIHIEDMQQQSLRIFADGRIILDINFGFILGNQYKEGKLIQRVFNQVFSENKSYKLHVLSPYVDYDYGEVHYQLLDSFNNILWNKKIKSKYMGHVYPEDGLFISNNGKVFIIQPDKIVIIDKGGNFFPIIKEESVLYNTFLSEYEDYRPITDDENFLFYIVNNSNLNETHLVCYSLEKYTVWRFKIEGSHFPSYLRTDNDKVITFIVSPGRYYGEKSLNLIVKDTRGEDILLLKKNIKGVTHPKVKYDRREKIITIKYNDNSEEFFEIK